MATPGQTPLDQDAERIISLATQLQNTLFGVTDIVVGIRNKFKDLSSETASFLQNSTKVKNMYEETISITAKLGKEYIDQDTVQKRILENAGLKKKIESQRDLIVSRTGLNELTTRAKIQDLIDRGVNITKKNAKNNGITVEEYRLFLLSRQIDLTKRNGLLLDVVNKKVKAGNDQFQEMQVKATALSKIFGSLSGIPFLKDFMDFKILSAEFQKGFGAGMTNLGKQLKSIITNPLFLAAAGIVALIAGFKALVKLAFDYDKIITDIANNTALSKDSTKSMLDSFRAISGESVKLVGSLDAAYLSVKNQANALIELNDSLETNALFTNEMIQNQILLTKQMKMSKEEAVGIQKMSLLTGQSAEKILNTAMKQNTTVISYKKIFSEIAKVNSEIATAYKNNPELIAKAVVEANKLGMSLEQTKSISKSLLDFETSIAGELESELLLGKRFNFEKARALALDGKSVEAAAELMGQIGGINALTQMNVIQRERLAASIGMSAEELTKSAREQAVLNALGAQNKEALEERYEILRKNGDIAGMEKLKAEAARKEGGQALLQDIARANLQDRFNESMERIKQIFTELAAGPMMTFLGGMTKLLQNTTLLKAILIGTAVVVGAIAASLTAAAIAITIAMGGANLAAAAAITGGVIGLGAVGIPMMLSGTNTAGEAALPNKNNLPTYNNNNQGNSYNNNQGNGYNNNQGGLAANQRSEDQRRIDISLNIDGKKVTTAMNASNYPGMA
jgi:hypothetical protein